jgi:hypothetical protein
VLTIYSVLIVVLKVLIIIFIPFAIQCEVTIVCSVCISTLEGREKIFWHWNFGNPEITFSQFFRIRRMVKSKAQRSINANILRRREYARSIMAVSQASSKAYCIIASSRLRG